MKHCIFSILFVYLSFLNCFGKEVPQKVRIELIAVKGFTNMACVPHDQVLEPSVGSGYWAAMKRLGDLVLENGKNEWLPSLTPLEQRIVGLAENHARHPEFAETLSEWYGRRMIDVRAELRGIEDNKAFEVWRAKNVRRLHTEPLHEEHMAKAYVPTWEAWLLAPGTREKDFIGVSACIAVANNSTDEIIPVLKYIVQLSLKNDPERINREMGFVLSILLRLKTEASVVAALETFALAKRHQMAPGDVMTLSTVRDAPDKSAIYDDIFVSYLSGRHPTIGKVAHHREGRAFLPAIEAALKRKDLDPGDGALLRRTADWIRECCLGEDGSEK